MSLEYDPTTSLSHWPTPMRRYGTNSYGEPLYRIVFTESRRHLVGGIWNGGERAYHWVPRYRQVSAPWILERWYTPFEYTGMTQMQWDSTMIDPTSGWLLLGPYPARGEYDLVWEFDAGVDNDSLDKIIACVGQGRKKSFGEVRAEHHEQYQQEEKQDRTERFDELRDARWAFGTGAISSSHIMRGSKTRDPIKTAEECGLPVNRTPGHSLIAG